ncbi:MAG: anti-sigma regulatory factor [bacterium]|nr:anti-sigma regulatory factor [bacterium]
MDTKIVEIREEKDVVICRQECRTYAKNLGFSLVDQTRITTAASELARNIFEYAKTGVVKIERATNEDKSGLKMTFSDNGPGIANVDLALKEGWSSHRGMGMGMPGSKRLMDEFSIWSELGKGTVITTIKWLR